MIKTGAAIMNIMLRTIAVFMLVFLTGTFTLAGCYAPDKALNVELKATPQSGPVPLKVDFSATPSGGTLPYESLVLNLGDGTTTTIHNDEVYTHTYSESREYVATVTIVDSRGNKSSDSITINALDARFVPGEVIVGYSDDGAIEEVKSLARQFGGEILTENHALRFLLVKVEAGNEEAFIKLISQKGENKVTYAELNYIAEAQGR